MVYLGATPFRGKKEQEAYDRTFAGKYYKLLRKNHFLYFGLPFMLSIVAGSFYLQRFTALKWERWDNKYQQVNEEEMLGMIENKRKFNKKDDYYRLQGLLDDHSLDVSEDYEIVRVARKKEDEPVWWRFLPPLGNEWGMIKYGDLFLGCFFSLSFLVPGIFFFIFIFFYFFFDSLLELEPVLLHCMEIHGTIAWTSRNSPHANFFFFN